MSMKSRTELQNQKGKRKESRNWKEEGEEKK